MLLAVNKGNSLLNVNSGFPHLTNTQQLTTKRDIPHLMPHDSDLSCQSELELEPPSVVELELEPDDDDEPESLPEWETSDKLLHSVAIGMLKKKCGTCLLCLVVGFLSFLTGDPIVKP